MQFTFIDLFAGAGGFSEGFLQVGDEKNSFDFLLASDINEDAELCHRLRYNHQLGMDVRFLREDIKSPRYIPQLRAELDSLARQRGVEKVGVDVVCGGPPCQSFSMAGERRDCDHKDNLFSYYLDVIREVRPKYFVIENVKGILSKKYTEDRLWVDIINEEIGSIIDGSRLDPFLRSLRGSLDSFPESHQVLFHALADSLEAKFHSSFPQDLKDFRERTQLEMKDSLSSDWDTDNFELHQDIFYDIHLEKSLVGPHYRYVQRLERMFADLCAEAGASLDLSCEARTVRGGLRLLKYPERLASLQRSVEQLKVLGGINQDAWEPCFNNFLACTSVDQIVDSIESALQDADSLSANSSMYDEFIQRLSAFKLSVGGALKRIKQELTQLRKMQLFYPTIQSAVDDLLEGARRLSDYRIGDPIVVNAENYGVPQSRERVLFIACRSDVDPIVGIPTTTKRSTVQEAIDDLKELHSNQVCTHYAVGLDDSLSDYIKASRCGRLRPDLQSRISDDAHDYVESIPKFKAGDFQSFRLGNHEVPNHQGSTLERLEVIQRHGSYAAAHEELVGKDLKTKKRNYSVLQESGVSPTVTCHFQDFVHYHNPRSPSVREMARLQSFDDSFIFPGKRMTGGTRRKMELCQYTLVGNSVPPLLAKAIASEVFNKLTAKEQA